MRILKSLVPIFVLLAGALYLYQNYEDVPLSISSGLTFLPHLLAIMVIGLSIHFSRSAIFFYTLQIIIANFVIRFGWVSDDILAHSLLATFIPLLFLSLALLPDRGIFNIKALPSYALILLAILFSVYGSKTSPEWLSQILLGEWLPAKYFDWARMTQTALLISVLALFQFMILCILQPTPHMAAGFGVLIMLVLQIHFGNQAPALNVFSGTALLMCLYAVMQESWRMAYLDELTGLPARRALKEKLEKLGGLYTVAMLDVDHFKKFNDTYGHDTGDAVLRMIAAKMSHVSGGGSSYRYGGEEFSIIFPGQNTDGAWHHLEDLRLAIAKSKFVINRADRRNKAVSKSEKPVIVQVTVSIGIADSKTKPDSPWVVLKQADQALYRAKGKGRNCVCE